jgi:hypothetical protein
MRNSISKNLIKAFLILICSSFGLQSCIMQRSLITVEHDIVYSSKRIKWKNTYRDTAILSPLNNLEQSIVKEINANKEVSYTVYDILTLSSNSFNLENKVFLIIDNFVEPMILEHKEYENTKNITENSSTEDSTNISVVTGYSEENKKITRFRYKLRNDVIDKIKKSEQILFRYYSGPNMITLTLKGLNLERLKMVLNES